MNPPAPQVLVVGGGQLARMTHQAAIALGISLTVLDPDPAAPAFLAGTRNMTGEATNLATMREFANLGGVVTFDHERVPIENLRALEDSGVQVYPGAAVAELAFNKLVARRRLAAAGYPVPAASSASSATDITDFAVSNGWPVVVKATRGGYDGKGVAVVHSDAEARDSSSLLGPDMVVEAFVAFDTELSVMVARNPQGEAACYDPVSTVQQDGVCTEVLAPATVAPSLRIAAMDLARSLAIDFDLVGVMAVELFAVGDSLLINELATRPHNSAHHTIEAAETSQFEQHLRAVLGWPLGSTRLRSPAAAMCNVLGPASGSDPRHMLPHALAVPGAHVHLYDKVPRSGRKLGHVTALGANLDDALATARRATAILSTEQISLTSGAA